MDLINIGLQVTSFTPTTTPTDVVLEPKSDTDKNIKNILTICGSFICSAYVAPVGTHLIFPDITYSLASEIYMLGNGCAQTSTIAACRVISSSTSRQADKWRDFLKKNQPRRKLTKWRDFLMKNLILEGYSEIQIQLHGQLLLVLVAQVVGVFLFI